MSTLGKLARGVATGLSGYYTEQAKYDNEQRRADILAAREQALANVNHANRVEEIRLAGQENRATHSAAVVDDVARDTALLGPKTDAQITADRARISAKAEADYRLLSAKTKADITLAQFKAQRMLELEGVKQSGEDRRNHEDNQTYLDTHPTATVENSAGEVVTTYGAGATTRNTTYRDSRPLRHPGSDDEEPGGYTKGIAPRAPVAPTAQTVETPQTYTMEDLTFTAQKHGITTDEARRRLNGAGYRLMH